MSRPRRDWLPALGEAAFAAFVTEGYRRTQVQDVATRMKVSIGTIYKQVESKEALFELAVRWALALPLEAERPLRSRPLAEITAMVRRKISARFVWPVLKAALRTGRSANGRAQLAAVLNELYDGCSRERRFIALLDRCAQDLPELAEAYVNSVKVRYLADLADFLRRQQRRGLIRATGGLPATARATIEAVVWMGCHRHFDSLPPPIDDADAREAIVAMLTQGVCRARANRRRIKPGQAMAVKHGGGRARPRATGDDLPGKPMSSIQRSRQP